MKRYVSVLVVLLVLAAMAGTASARARGYGIVFGGTEPGRPGVDLPWQASVER